MVVFADSSKTIIPLKYRIWGPKCDCPRPTCWETVVFRIKVLTLLMNLTTRMKRCKEVILRTTPVEAVLFRRYRIKSCMARMLMTTSAGNGQKLSGSTHAGQAYRCLVVHIWRHCRHCLWFRFEISLDVRFYRERFYLHSEQNFSSKKKSRIGKFCIVVRI